MDEKQIGISGGENLSILDTSKLSEELSIKRRELSRIALKIENLTKISQSLEVELSLIKELRTNLTNVIFSSATSKDEKEQANNQENLIEQRVLEVNTRKLEVEQKLEELSKLYNEKNNVVENLNESLSSLTIAENEKLKAKKLSPEYKKQVFERATTKRLPFVDNLFETTLDGLLSFWDKQTVGNLGARCVYRVASLEETTDEDISNLNILVHKNNIYKAIEKPLDVDLNSEISPSELLTNDYYVKVKSGVGYNLKPRSGFLANLEILFRGIEGVLDLSTEPRVEILKKLLNNFPKAVKFLPNNLFDRNSTISLIQNELMVALAKLKDDKINKKVTVEAQERYAKEVFELFNKKLQNAKAERFKRKAQFDF